MANSGLALNDPIFSNKEYYNPLEDFFFYKLKKTINLTDKDLKVKVKELLHDISIDKLIQDKFNKLLKYYKSGDYLKDEEKVNFKIEGNSNKINFTVDKYNFTLATDLFHKIKKQYNDKFDLGFEYILTCLCLRYMIFGSISFLQQALHPILFRQFKKELDIKVELFSSILNVYEDNKYFSLFYDIEKYFGSFGSVYYADFISGNYEATIPSDETMNIVSVNKILDSIKKDDILFVVKIVGWGKQMDKYKKEYCSKERKMSQMYLNSIRNKKINVKNSVPNKILKNNIYEDYKPLLMIQKSKYLQYTKFLCTDEILWYDYRLKKPHFRGSSIFLYISNHKLNLDKIKDIKYSY